MAEIAPARPAANADLALSVQLRRDRGGAVIAEERVSSRDIADPFAELWFEACLRRGAAQLGLSDVRARLRPVFREDAETGRYCAGFDLEIDGAGAAREARFFPRECLAHVAARRAVRLVEEGVLERGESYYYALAPIDDASGNVVTGLPARGAPGFERRRLQPLLDRARRVDVIGARAGGDPYPVFFTQDAMRRAERVSRAGGAQTPPVETGGLLVGPLCLCPETGEIFAVVVDVIEAAGSESSTYSLTYAGPTWSRIQQVLRARRQRPETRHHRVLGQTHGHNFIPYDGVPPCDECHRRKICTRSSAYLSEDDRLWCRAVFHCEPWQLSQVYGLDARRDGVEAFYGQRHGALVRRGYRVIENLEMQEETLSS